jgi:hypothetical protein
MLNGAGTLLQDKYPIVAGILLVYDIQTTTHARTAVVLPKSRLEERLVVRSE